MVIADGAAAAFYCCRSGLLGFTHKDVLACFFQQFCSVFSTDLTEFRNNFGIISAITYLLFGLCLLLSGLPPVTILIFDYLIGDELPLRGTL